MSAVIALHPAARDLMVATDWGFAMVMSGYDVRMKRLQGGVVTLVAQPRSPIHTNAHRIKRPRYAGQYRHVRLPDDPPPSAA